MSSGKTAPLEFQKRAKTGQVNFLRADQCTAGPSQWRSPWATHYNTRGLPATTRYSLGGMDLTHRTLSYDRNGNLSSISDSVAMIDAATCRTDDTVFCDGLERAAAPVGTADRSYRYDALDRLTKLHSSVHGDYPCGYDPLGNIRSARFATYQYDAATNLLTAPNGDPISHDTRRNSMLANQRGMTGTANRSPCASPTTGRAVRSARCIISWCAATSKWRA